MHSQTENDVCCIEFDVAKWDGKTHTWKDKLFISETIPQFLHMPLPGRFARAVRSLDEKARAAKVELPKEDAIMLSYDPSPWKSVLFWGVSAEVPGAQNVHLSGTFISKVFDGPYNHIPKFIKQMGIYLLGLNKQAKRLYFSYAYCPKCAKKYGHNYITIIAEV